MRVLLDEDVPEPLAQALGRICAPHQIHSVHELNWSAKKDRFLFADAAQRRFEALITADKRQLVDPTYCKQLRRYGLHHVLFAQPPGRRGMALAMGAVFAAIDDVLSALEEADSQRLVQITAISASSPRFSVCDPRLDPPAYWPRTRSPGRPRAARRRTSV